jgi:hypothetical protein
MDMSKVNGTVAARRLRIEAADDMLEALLAVADDGALGAQSPSTVKKVLAAISKAIGDA